MYSYVSLAPMKDLTSKCRILLILLEIHRTPGIRARWILSASNTLQGSGLGGSLLHPMHPSGSVECIGSRRDPPSLDPWSALEAAGIHLDGPPWHPIHSRDPLWIQYTPGIHLGGSPLNPIYSRDPPRWIPTESNTLQGSTWVDPFWLQYTLGIHLGGSLECIRFNGDPLMWIPGVYWIQWGSTQVDPRSVLDSVGIHPGGSLECIGFSGDPPKWIPGVYWIQWGST